MYQPLTLLMACCLDRCATAVVAGAAEASCWPPPPVPTAASIRCFRPTAAAQTLLSPQLVAAAGTSLYVTTRHSYHLFVWLLLLLLLKWACFEQINLGEAAIRVVCNCKAAINCH